MKISVTIFIFFGLYFINAQEKVILKGMTKKEIKALKKQEKEKQRIDKLTSMGLNQWGIDENAQTWYLALKYYLPTARQAGGIPILRQYQTFTQESSKIFPLSKLNLDLSPTEKPLSPQFFKLACSILYLPNEKSAQSFFALFTFKFFTKMFEKSRSKASKKELFISIFFKLPEEFLILMESSQIILELDKETLLKSESKKFTQPVNKFLSYLISLILSF